MLTYDKGKATYCHGSSAKWFRSPVFSASAQSLSSEQPPPPSSAAAPPSKPDRWMTTAHDTCDTCGHATLHAPHSPLTGHMWTRNTSCAGFTSHIAHGTHGRANLTCRITLSHMTHGIHVWEEPHCGTIPSKDAWDGWTGNTPMRRINPSHNTWHE
jgi:hypothetical protein